MKYEVKHLTDDVDKQIEVDTYLHKIKSGVWLLYCQFMERWCYHGYGTGGDISGLSVYFGDDDKILLEVRLFGSEDLMLFGDMSKHTFHGTVFTDEAYNALVSDKEEV